MLDTTSLEIPMEPRERGEKRVLLLVHRVPYPPDKGDRIRSYHLLEHLAKFGQVDLAFLADEPLPSETMAALRRLCSKVAAVPISKAWRWARAFRDLARGRSLTEGLFDSPAMHSLIGRWLEENSYDAVVCFSSGVLPYVLKRDLDSRLVVDMVDADSQKWFDYADRAGGLKAALFRLEGRRVRALEKAAGRARAVVFATEAEANLYRGFCPEARVESISNGVDLDYFRPFDNVDEIPGCVFVGQLDYRANVIGLEWFCQEAWPVIRGRLPTVTFQIVGRNPVPSVQRLGKIPGVEVVGSVADVRPYLAAARVAIVPLPVARGVQNKVLEAMAMGRPVVASPAALEGLSLVPGRDALAAGDAEEWAGCLASLWDDPARRAELGQNARRYVETHHQWDSCLGRFDELMPANMDSAFERKN